MSDPVATGAGLQPVQNSLARCQRSARHRTRSGSDWIQALNADPTGLSASEIVDSRLNVGSGRYRSRFCNDSPTLRNGINSGNFTEHRQLSF